MRPKNLKLLAFSGFLSVLFTVILGVVVRKTYGLEFANFIFQTLC